MPSMYGPNSTSMTLDRGGEEDGPTKMGALGRYKNVQIRNSHGKVLDVCKFVSVCLCVIGQQAALAKTSCEIATFILFQSTCYILHALEKELNRGS